MDARWETCLLCYLKLHSTVEFGTYRNFFPVYVSYFNPVALCLDSSSINNNQIKENGFSWLQGIAYYTKTPL